MTGAGLSTHVLDTARGRPAQGVRVELHDVTGHTRRRLNEAITNADGRTDAPLIERGTLSAGTYELTFSADGLGPDDLLTGALKDAGGALEIAGTVTITPPRSYEVTGTARPRPEAPPELRSALQMLGPATADGSHALSLAGSF